MNSDKVADFKKSLEAILRIDPKATYRFEDCGSGTNAVNIDIQKTAAKRVTQKDLEILKDLGVYCANEEGESVIDKLTTEYGYGFFFVLS